MTVEKISVAISTVPPLLQERGKGNCLLLMELT